MKFEGAPRNPEVDALNGLIADLAREYELPFVASPDELYDHNGFMKAEYARDDGNLGEHLNYFGYKIWAEAIRPHVEQHN